MLAHHQGQKMIIQKTALTQSGNVIFLVKTVKFLLVFLQLGGLIPNLNSCFFLLVCWFREIEV